MPDVAVSVARPDIQTSVSVEQRPPASIAVSPGPRPDVSIGVVVARPAVTVGVVPTSGVAPSGIARVQDDPAPKLGGDLDLNAKKILGSLEGVGLILDGGLID